MAETFTCESCGQTFGKKWTDEEAFLESADVFGVRPVKDLATICDDCWRAMGFDQRRARVSPSTLGVTPEEPA